MSSLKAIQKKERNLEKRRQQKKFDLEHPEIKKQEEEEEKRRSQFGGSLDWNAVPKESQQFTQNELDELAKDETNRVFTFVDNDTPNQKLNPASLKEKSQRLYDMFHFYRRQLYEEEAKLEFADIKRIERGFLAYHPEWDEFRRCYNQFWTVVFASKNHPVHEPQYFESWMDGWSRYELAAQKRMTHAESEAYYGSYLLERHGEKEATFQAKNPDVKVIASKAVG